MEIHCMYCGTALIDGSNIVLSKEPHRAPRPAHIACGDRAIEQSRGRVSVTPKQIVRGVILDRVDSRMPDVPR